MAFRGRGKGVQKVMVQPINLIFRFLQNRARISVWLFEQATIRIEGRVVGFDEYMNLVMDDAEEVDVKSKERKSLDLYNQYSKLLHLPKDNMHGWRTGQETHAREKAH